MITGSSSFSSSLSSSAVMEALKSAAAASKQRVLDWPMNHDARDEDLDLADLLKPVLDRKVLWRLVGLVRGKLGPKLYQQQELEGLVAYLEGLLMPDADVKPKILVPDLDAVNWEEAFFASCGDGSVSTHLLSKLDGYVEDWDGGVAWQAPYSAVVQSSGWGKSRSICDLSKHGVFVVYCSFMKQEYSGFPRRSEVAKCFDGDITKHVVCAYLRACLEVLADTDMSPEKWLELQIRDNAVGEAIFKRFKEVLPEMNEKKTNLELKESLLDVVEALEEKKGESLRKDGNLQVLFAFDEGNGLKDFSTSFFVFRQALSCLPMQRGIFVVFADTNASVANFTPSRGVSSRDLDPKGRVRKHGQQLFDPIHLIGKADMFVPVRRTQRTRQDLVPKVIFMHGRPLWAVHLSKTKGKVGRADLDELVRFAIWKLLGGKTVETEGLTKRDAAAVFMACIGPEVSSRSYLAKELVAGHMATCVATADERQTVLVLGMSEAVLGEAAAYILHQLGFLERALTFLGELVTEGLVLEGERGELVVRMVFLLCMHKCTNPKGTSFFTGCVTLTKFLQTMFGKDWKASECKSDYLDAEVCFNHFVPLCRGVEITKERLWEFLTHGAAILYPRGEFATDIGIPWAKFDKEGRVVELGILEVQVKNRLRLTARQTSDAWNKLKRKFPGQSESPMVILNLGGDEYNLDQAQTGTAAFDISQEMYPFLDKGVVEALVKVLKADTDFRAYLTEEEVGLVKAMAVLSL